jgi:DNA-directed RNA polymerase subunit alpha
LLLNLKEIIFKTSFSIIENKEQLKVKGFLKIKGPIIVTAGMFQLPKNNFKILNPNQYICTIVDNSDLYIEIDIENGKGYKLIEEIRKYENQQNSSLTKPSTLIIDAIFMPVKRVNYKIKMIHDTKGNIKESLTLEVWTNGTISPRRSIQESLKILMNLFYPLFVDDNFMNLSLKNLAKSN